MLSPRRALALVAAAWIGRWLALQLAALAGHKLLPPGSPPRESPWPPGWMPGPFDR